MNPIIYRTFATQYVSYSDGEVYTTWVAQRRKTTKILGFVTYTRWVPLVTHYPMDSTVRTFPTEQDAWNACKVDAAARTHGVQHQVGRVGDPLSSVSVSVINDLGTNP